MKFKKFIHKWVLNNIGYKIMAVVFAFILWLVVVNVQDPENSKTISGIPVEILNEQKLPDSEYVYSVVSGDTCTVVVTGKKSVINKLKASDFTATADFNELSITYAVPIKVSLNTTNASQVTITQKTMSMVLTLDTIETVEVPVEINYAGKLGDNMVIENAVVTPETIKITAPKTTAEKISRVQVTINQEDVEDGVTLRATPVIYNIGGGVVELNEDVTSDCDEVAVAFDVDYTKEVEISTSYTGTPATGYKVDAITNSFSTVIIKGKADALEDVSKIRIPSTVLDVSGATADVTVKVDMEEYLPAGTEIYDNNVNLIVTAVIKKSSTVTETTTSAEDNS